MAPEIWRRFGNVANYVEPFFGSGAVLLGRPHWRPDGKRLVETVNDADGLLTNFWRAVAADPEAVAHHAAWPVNEIDMRARHAWLVGEREAITASLTADPLWFDPRAAGWWAWGLGANAIPDGLHTTRARAGVAGRSPQGAVALDRRGGLLARCMALAERLKFARIKSGDWARCVKSPAAMGGIEREMFGVFLDPPYAGTDAQYATTGSVETDVWAWAVEAARGERMRICVAGYEDGRTVPDGWAVVTWEGHGGYGRRANGAGRANAKRERLWFSPHCLDPDAGQMALL